MSPFMSLRDPRVAASGALLATVALALATWRAGLQPAMRALATARHGVSASQRVVSDTEAMLASGGGDAAWRQREQAHLDALQRRLVSSRQMPRILDAVLEQVAQSSLRLVNVAQGNLEPALDASGHALALHSAPCLTLPVTISVEGRFQGVVECLARWMNPSFPALARIDRVQCTLRDPLTGRLTAEIHVRLYALGE